LLFKLLQNVRFVGEVEIREKLRTVHSFVRPLLPTHVATRRSVRRMDVAVTYVDGEGKSGQYYASRYAEENAIDSRAIFGPKNFGDALQRRLDRNEPPRPWWSSMTSWRLVSHWQPI
jgi:hypothetical protein